MVSVPILEDYGISLENGFLPPQPPLDSLPGTYYEPWEDVIRNLQDLILSDGLREVVDKLPLLSTDQLSGEPQWRRAYSALAFITHAYIWSGKRPAERVPPSIAVPFLQTCKHLQLPPVATYAGLVLWNWKPISFDLENDDTLANLAMIDTFTGSLDEKWFYLISVAIESKGAPLIPMMLRAIQAASRGNHADVTYYLQFLAERLDDIGSTLTRIYDHCDPHVFYNRIRPFLAGSKNMAEAGLPNGVIFDNGGSINKQRYVQFSGGSNAQSSIIQFFDLILGVEHRPIGQKQHSEVETGKKRKGTSEPNFIHEMRKYMPGPHARFLERIGEIANIRQFVQNRRHDRELSLAFDACVDMLVALRNKHIQIVSRYIVVKSREAKKPSTNTKDGKSQTKIDLAHRPKSAASEKQGDKRSKDLKGTGGSSLIPFLRQSRDETGEPAGGTWVRQVLSRQGSSSAKPDALDEDSERLQGLAGTWRIDGSAGGLCLY